MRKAREMCDRSRDLPHKLGYKVATLYAARGFFHQKNHVLYDLLRYIRALLYSNRR